MVRKKSGAAPGFRTWCRAPAGISTHPPAAGTVLGAVDAEDRLALDDVDDLVSGMRLLGAGVLPGPDRHHGGLAQRSLLQDLEEPPPKPPNIHHVAIVSPIPSC